MILYTNSVEFNADKMKNNVKYCFWIYENVDRWFRRSLWNERAIIIHVCWFCARTATKYEKEK